VTPTVVPRQILPPYPHKKKAFKKRSEFAEGLVVRGRGLAGRALPSGDDAMAPPLLGPTAGIVWKMKKATNRSILK